MAGDPAQNEFAQAACDIAAHDEKIGAQRRHLIDERRAEDLPLLSTAHPCPRRVKRQICEGASGTGASARTGSLQSTVTAEAVFKAARRRERISRLAAASSRRTRDPAADGLNRGARHHQDRRRAPSAPGFERRDDRRIVGHIGR